MSTLEHDFRSDSVTQPTETMKVAMQSAPLGDGAFDEDTTVKQLEEMVAGMFGKEAGLWVCSADMGNLICALAHCCGSEEQPQGDYVVDDQSEFFFFEQKAKWGSLANLHPRALPCEADGTILISTLHGIVQGGVRMVSLESTHLRKGGKILSVEYIDAVGEVCHQEDVKLHIDGSRILNAATGARCDPKRIVAAADSVVIDTALGLGAPAGALIVGTAEFIALSDNPCFPWFRGPRGGQVVLWAM